MLIFLNAYINNLNFPNQKPMSHVALLYVATTLNVATAAIYRKFAYHFMSHDFLPPLNVATPISHKSFNTAQDSARGRESCCIFHYLSCTDSIKPSLQFSFLYFGLVALEESTFPKIFKFSTAGVVKCCVSAVKNRPDSISVLLYFFGSFGMNDSNTFNI